MKRAVAAGDYDDPQEFVRTAIENQIQLEEEASQEAKTLEEALNSVEPESEIEASTEEPHPDDSAHEQAQKRQSDDAEPAPPLRLSALILVVNNLPQRIVKIFQSTE